MTATYTTPPVADRDYVRLLIGDTSVSAPKFQDEELDGILSEESRIRGAAAQGRSLRYFAAAEALDILITRFSTKGKGLASVIISGLSITQGLTLPDLEAGRKQVAAWRARANRLLATESGGVAFFRMARRPTYY